MLFRYLDLLVKESSVATGGIYGKDGAVWATRPNFVLSAQEVKDIVAGMRNSEFFRTRGVVAAGIKYTFLRATETGGLVARKGPNTLLCEPTIKSILCVITKEGANPANVQMLQFVRTNLLKKNF